MIIIIDLIPARICNCYNIDAIWLNTMFATPAQKFVCWIVHMQCWSSITRLCCQDLPAQVWTVDTFICFVWETQPLASKKERLLWYVHTAEWRCINSFTFFCNQSLLTLEVKVITKTLKGGTLPGQQLGWQVFKQITVPAPSPPPMVCKTESNISSSNQSQYNVKCFHCLTHRSSAPPSSEPHQVI